MAYTEQQCDKLWENAWTGLYGLTIAKNTNRANLYPKQQNKRLSPQQTLNHLSMLIGGKKL